MDAYDGILRVTIDSSVSILWPLKAAKNWIQWIYGHHEMLHVSDDKFWTTKAGSVASHLVHLQVNQIINFHIILETEY